ncbi:hypothetical protein SK128_005716 [Halocaridina rubra]|uniref:Uncharacterized protein n=1 Tax=Halocaridina rubra TaxID=373956 RepID=A0AAN8WME2_HALRR
MINMCGNKKIVVVVVVVVDRNSDGHKPATAVRVSRQKCFREPSCLGWVHQLQGNVSSTKSALRSLLEENDDFGQLLSNSVTMHSVQYDYPCKSTIGNGWGTPPYPSEQTPSRPLHLSQKAAVSRIIPPKPLLKIFLTS